MPCVITSHSFWRIMQRLMFDRLAHALRGHKSWISRTFHACYGWWIPVGESDMHTQGGETQNASYREDNQWLGSNKNSITNHVVQRRKDRWSIEFTYIEVFLRTCLNLEEQGSWEENRTHIGLFNSARLMKMCLKLKPWFASAFNY